MTEPDPRLERHRPALRYDSQEPFRAMSAASITDHRGNTLLGRDGSVLARAGEGLSLEYLGRYPTGTPDARDRLDTAPDPIEAARELQADPRYADRCYGRVVPDGGARGCSTGCGPTTTPSTCWASAATRATGS